MMKKFKAAFRKTQAYAELKGIMKTEDQIFKKENGDYLLPQVRDAKILFDMARAHS